MYKDLVKNISDFNLQIPNTIVPIPTELDYDNGFIRRYFVQKTNDDNGFIFEVSNQIYDNYINSPFWKTTDLKWRIKGSKIPIYKQDGTLEDTGVENSNKAAISLASLDMRSAPTT